MQLSRVLPILAIGASTGALRASWVEYDISYDPLEQLTTLTASPANDTCVEFWTYSGDQISDPMGLNPGFAVQIDALGNVIADAGALADFWQWTCNNAYHKNKRWTITNRDPSDTDVIIDDLTEGKQYTLDKFGDQHSIPKCHKFKVSGGKWAGGSTGLVPEESIVTGQPGSDAVFFADDWPGPPEQERIRLLSGTLTSFDSMEAFTSIFTLNVVTGCPEPASFSLVLLGCIVCRRRR